MKRSRSALLPFLILALLCASTARAGINTWTANGPEGGFISTFAFVLRTDVCCGGRLRIGRCS